MEGCLRPLVSYRLYRTIIRQKKKRILEKSKNTVKTLLTSELRVTLV